MSVINYLSNLIIPAIIVFIILYGYAAKINIYEAFVEGASEGVKVVVGILPTLVGLMLAIGVIRVSGILDLVVYLIKPLTSFLRFPPELVPLSIMRPISYSGSLGFLFDIFKTQGPDSYIGRVASVIMCSTETIFYTMSIYLMSVGIKKGRYILKGALLSSLAGIIASLLIIRYLF